MTTSTENFRYGMNVQQLFKPESTHSLEQQVALLADITQCFASSLDIGQTLRNAIEQFVHYLDAEAASIFLLENDGKELVCHESVGPVEITGLRLQANQGIVGKTVCSRGCRMVRDARNDPDFAETVDLGTGFITRSILCAPLIVQGQCLGALELINKRTKDGLFDDDDKNLLMALASASALAIRNAQVADAMLEQERMRRELEMAREIQMDLLPKDENRELPVHGMNVPALEVSGDFYDFFRRDDGLIYFNLADVSGKGMNSALLMAKVSSLLHHLAKTISDPGELLSRVNNEVCETVSHGMFVTIVSGFIDRENKRIRFANAGHQPPLYHHLDEQFEEFPADAPPLGIEENTVFPIHEIQMDGGTLYLFTDGVTETVGKDNKPIDVAGLIKLIQMTGMTKDSNERLEDIIAHVRKLQTKQRDDITMMMIECGSQ